MKPRNLSTNPNPKFYDKRLESVVLGAILRFRDAIVKVQDLLKPDMFYLEAHQLVFLAILRLFNKNKAIDIVTVTSELRKSGDFKKSGGAYYLLELVDSVESDAHIEGHARIIVELAMRRAALKICDEIKKQALDYTISAIDVIDQFGERHIKMIEHFSTKPIKRMIDIVPSFLKELEAASKKADGLTGISTGFEDIDRMTGGWQNTDLIILAARPGMGKTAITMAMAKSAAEFGKKVAIFSLEMSANQLLGRMASLETEISGKKIKSGNLEDREWHIMTNALEKISELDIVIDDTAGININELRAKCRKLKLREGLDMIVIDYLQLMSGSGKKGQNREQEISEISRGLKQIAKELDVPVIALSQLSRAVENRGGAKRPMLSDLRESGSIEQDSDIVTFLYRPEYYQILEDEEGCSLKGIGEFIFAKHRNGALGTVKLRFLDYCAKFKDLDLFSNALEAETVVEEIKEKAEEANNIFSNFRPSSKDLEDAF